MSIMISEHIINASGAGFISMIYFFAYGVGQMINGFAGDYMNPKNMIFSGLFISGIANLLMGICHDFWAMILIWGINGYFQAMIWAPIIRIFAEMMDEKSRINSSVNIVTSQLIGTLLSYILSATVLSITGWEWVFTAAAIFLLGVSILWKAGFERICRKAERREEYTEEKKKSVDQNPSVRSVLAASGIVIMIFPVIVHGMLKDGVTTWVPTYIENSFTVSASFSILLTSVLPLINLTGAYVARFFYGKLGGSIARSVGLFFGIALAALIALYCGGAVSPILSALLLAVITASMIGVNTLMVNIFPLRFKKYGKVSGISGFLNAMAYLGTAVSTYFIGLLVEYRGWKITILSWCIVTAAAGVMCILAIRNEKRERIR